MKSMVILRFVGTISQILIALGELCEECGDMTLGEMAAGLEWNP